MGGGCLYSICNIPDNSSVYCLYLINKKKIYAFFGGSCEIDGCEHCRRDSYTCTCKISGWM